MRGHHDDVRDVAQSTTAGCGTLCERAHRLHLRERRICGRVGVPQQQLAATTRDRPLAPDAPGDPLVRAREGVVCCVPDELVLAPG